MSYARFARDSSVYVFLNTEGRLECCGCNLRSDDEVKARGHATLRRTTVEMVEHLDAHRAAGQKVPKRTYAALRADAEENDQWIRDYDERAGGLRAETPVESGDG